MAVDDLEPMAYTIDRAAEMLSIGRSTIFKLIAQRRIRVVRMSGVLTHYIAREDLQSFLDEEVHIGRLRAATEEMKEMAE